MVVVYIYVYFITPLHVVNYSNGILFDKEFCFDLEDLTLKSLIVTVSCERKIETLRNIWVWKHFMIFFYVLFLRYFL